jgi:hypothetical protein
MKSFKAEQFDIKPFRESVFVKIAEVGIMNYQTFSCSIAACFGVS